MTWEWVAWTGIVCVTFVFVVAAFKSAPRKREKSTEVFRGRGDAEKP